MSVILFYFYSHNIFGPLCATLNIIVFQSFKKSVAGKRNKWYSRVIWRKVHRFTGEFGWKVGEVSVRLKARFVRRSHLLLLKLRTNKMQRLHYARQCYCLSQGDTCNYNSSYIKYTTACPEILAH